MTELISRENKIDIQVFATKVNESMSEIKSSVSRLESKFKDVLNSIDNKFDIWKLDAISKMQYSSDSLVVENSDNIVVSKSEHDLLLKQINAQENEISLLQNELSDKNNAIDKLMKEKKEIGLEKLPKYETEISTLQSLISNLELQINTLNGQNNLLVISNNDKDSLMREKQEDLIKMNFQVGRCEGEKVKLEESINILRALLSQNNAPYDNNTQESNFPPSNINELPDVEDVYIIHDSLFKEINPGLTKKERVSVKKIWAPKICDALHFVKNSQVMPKVILLHTSTNDLEVMDAEQIVSIIGEIYQVVNDKNAKFIWSNIVPRNDNLSLNAKAALINAMVGVHLMNKEGVFFIRNDNFYLGDMIDPALFHEDGVHMSLV